MKKAGIFAMKGVGAVVVVLNLIGCSPDVDDELLLSGSWKEESPAENRTEFYFYTDDRVLIDRAGEKQDRTYFIEGDSLYLQREQGSSATAVYFRQINENAFQVGNIYPGIPEDQPSFMIFRRANSNSVDPTLE